ncbi:cytochrome P450 [Mycena vulgaris]|nr:cytochrome P450 [Mycena vulgaris]
MACGAFFGFYDQEKFSDGLSRRFPPGRCDQYGNTVMTKLLFEAEISTLEPEYIKAILATDFDNYWKGPNDSRLGHSLLGFGIFNSDDEMWRFHRNLSRPFFSRERISDFEIFDRHAHEALASVKTRLAEGYPIDFQDMISRFTLDSATEFLFRRSVDSMSAGLPYPQSSPLANSPSFLNHPSNTYVKSFVRSQIVTVERAPYGTKWPLREFWTDRVKPDRKIIDEYVEPILNEELKKKAKERTEGKSDERETFLSHLVQATDNKEIIRDSIFNILIAGRDTTAATLTFGVYMLAEHPEIMERLRSEILSTVGSSKMPTYDDIRNMKYLRAFINETLRLYPPVPFDSRSSKNATTWPPLKQGDRPLYVTPKTRCRYSVFLMHRRTDLWGPDALKFDPDRFLDERVRKYLTPNPFIFLPFNAGPRICLGQQFAYHEASFFLVRLLQNFCGFSLASDAQPEATKPPASWKEAKGTQATEKIMLGLHLTMYAKGGLWVRMKEVAVE